MKTAGHFEAQVLRKRPYILRASCGEVIRAPLRRAAQNDGRIRFWGEGTDPRDGTVRTLRVVTLADGETIHDAIFDRGFIRDTP